MREISNYSTHVHHSPELTQSSQKFGVEAAILSMALTRCQMAGDIPVLAAWCPPTALFL